MQKISTLLGSLKAEEILKLIFHSPYKGSSYIKTCARIISVKGELCVQFESFTKTQVFHKNIRYEDFVSECLALLKEQYKKLSLQTTTADYDIFPSNDGGRIIKHIKKEVAQVKINDHNKKKQYILSENEVVPPLVDMGVMTADGKIIKSKYDKFKQINRFLEMIQDSIINHKGVINIVDFGCGKSYLTFILYHYLENVAKIEANIIGLDLKKDVIDNCNKVAKKYNYTRLKFVTQDIKDYLPENRVDMVITLHACDTATDYALHNAIEWGAKYIFSVPCCQHELNAQIKSEKFAVLTNYGIVKERIAALMTDTIRCNLLEYKGYNVQLLEFVDFSHSPKNLLIRAKIEKGNKNKDKALKEVENIMEEFSLNPLLYRLLGLGKE